MRIIKRLQINMKKELYDETRDACEKIAKTIRDLLRDELHYLEKENREETKELGICFRRIRNLANAWLEKFDEVNRK